MRLNLREIIHVPGASLPFAFSLDLSQTDFYGAFPISRPVEVSGRVTNHAGALALEGEVKSLLDLTCDRCVEGFTREKTVPLRCLLATELEGEEEDDLVLLDGEELDVGDLAASAFILDMDIKNLCSENCAGLCAGCGANLNREPCRCKPQGDPRWGVLSRLLDTTE